MLTIKYVAVNFVNEYESYMIWLYVNNHVILSVMVVRDVAYGIFTLYRICSLKQFIKTFNSNFILI